MRRSIAFVALAGLVSLLHAPEVLGGGGQAGDAAEGKISGPAIAATIVINPTDGSETKGQTTVRLSKGSAYSAALFQHAQATTVPPPNGWIRGCDGVNGAQTPASTAPKSVRGAPGVAPAGDANSLLVKA